MFGWLGERKEVNETRDGSARFADTGEESSDRIWIGQVGGERVLPGLARGMADQHRLHIEVAETVGELLSSTLSIIGDHDRPGRWREARSKRERSINQPYDEPLD